MYMKRLFTIIAVTFTAILSIFAKNNEVLVPIDTIDVVCHDLKLDTDFIGLFGMAYIFANNSEYKLTGAIYADSIPPGTYTNCVMDLKHIETQKKVLQLLLPSLQQQMLIATASSRGI